MILTKEFLEKQNACEPGKNYLIDNQYVGRDYFTAIKDLINLDEEDAREYEKWLIEQKKSETYVRANGSVFKMGSFQVFNPLTGTHTMCETEQEARLLLVEIGKQILEMHKPTVCRELLNENGDSTWIPDDLASTLIVS